MAYDRYDTRSERGRWTNDRTSDRDRFRDDNYGRAGGPPRGDQDRGFFERAGDEIASWFGDDDAERRRDRDRRFEERGYGPARGGRDWDRGRDEDRGFLSSTGYRGHGGSAGGFRTARARAISATHQDSKVARSRCSVATPPRNRSAIAVPTIGR